MSLWRVHGPTWTHTSKSSSSLRGGINFNLITAVPRHSFLTKAKTLATYAYMYIISYSHLWISLGALALAECVLFQHARIHDAYMYSRCRVSQMAEHQFCWLNFRSNKVPTHAAPNLHWMPFHHQANSYFAFIIFIPEQGTAARGSLYYYYVRIHLYYNRVIHATASLYIARV